MHVRAWVVAVAILMIPAATRGESWTSPDGALSVMAPDAAKFDALPSPPAPMLAVWIAHDGSVTLGVMRSQVPPHARLEQTAVEEGLAEETGGKVTRLPTKQLSGNDVWSMTSVGPLGELTQRIVRIDGASYKVMAVAKGDNADRDAASRFLDSLSLGPKAVATTPIAGPVTDDDQLHNLSKQCGAFGVLLGIALLVYFNRRGKKQTPARAD